VTFVGKIEVLGGKVAMLMIALRVAQQGGSVATGANGAVPGSLETGTGRDTASKLHLKLYFEESE
jgi:hypothetical protein